MVGVCVVGQVTFAGNGPPTVVRRVSRVRITRLRVRGFSGDGIFALGPARFRLDHSRLTANGGYGVFSLNARGVTYADDYSAANGDAGFYVGESNPAGVRITRNTSIGNAAEGILLRSAVGGVVLFRCATCGDEDRGVLTVIVEDDGDEIVWRSLADSSPGLDGWCHFPEDYPDLSGLRFNAADYRPAPRRR